MARLEFKHLQPYLFPLMVVDLEPDKVQQQVAMDGLLISVLLCVLLLHLDERIKVLILLLLLLLQLLLPHDVVLIVFLTLLTLKRYALVLFKFGCEVGEH